MVRFALPAGSVQNIESARIAAAAGCENTTISAPLTTTTSAATATPFGHRLVRVGDTEPRPDPREPGSPTAATVARSPLSFSAGAGTGDRFSRRGKAATYRPNEADRLANSTRSSSCAAAAGRRHRDQGHARGQPRHRGPGAPPFDIRVRHEAQKDRAEHKPRCVRSGGGCGDAGDEERRDADVGMARPPLSTTRRLMRACEVDDRHASSSNRFGEGPDHAESPGAAIGQSRLNVRRLDGHCRAAGRPATDATAEHENKARIRR